MNKKIVLVVLTYTAVSIGAFVLVTVTTPPATEISTETGLEVSTKDDDENESGSSATPSIETAEKLVGETLTRQEVKERLGKWEKFEMSSNGCERGVFAGRFYYEGFIIFSRTYDKGETFSIVSINE